MGKGNIRGPRDHQRALGPVIKIGPQEHNGVSGTQGGTRNTRGPRDHKGVLGSKGGSGTRYESGGATMGLRNPNEAWGHQWGLRTTMGLGHHNGGRGLQWARGHNGEGSPGATRGTGADNGSRAL